MCSQTENAQALPTWSMKIISLLLASACTPHQKSTARCFLIQTLLQRAVLEVRDACTDEVLFTAPRTANKYIGYAIGYLQDAVRDLEKLQETLSPNDEAITALDLDDLDRLRNSFNSLKMAESYYAKIRTEIPRVNR